ncbi:hypothetical protein BX666DRAFT_1910905 [Dichotomocladium elegans]|nr:hypothetical protein BX666DRAFT_1910905 [Dichotomocladium elegans]
MQTPRDDDDDFQYTIASTARLSRLQLRRKRRILISEASASVTSRQSERSSQPPPVLSPVDGKQFSVVSGILSPKSPRSPSKASLLLDDVDTHYTSSEVAETHWQLTDVLPAESPENFYKAIPSYVPDNIRVNQLFLWAAQYNQQKLASKRQHHDHHRRNHLSDSNTNAEVDRIVARVQSRLIEQMAKCELNPTSYKHHKEENWGVGKKIPHPVNEKNRKRIAELEQMIQMLQSELLEWEQISVNLFSEHASTLDELSAPRDKAGHRIATYCKDHTNEQGTAMESVNHPVTDLNIDTAIMRQQLYILDQFRAAASDYSEACVEEIITKSKSKAPCFVKEGKDHDPKTFLPDVVAKEEKERGKEAVIDILRVLGRCHRQ